MSPSSLTSLNFLLPTSILRSKAGPAAEKVHEIWAQVEHELKGRLEALDASGDSGNEDSRRSLWNWYLEIVMTDFWCFTTVSLSMERE